MTGEDPEDAEGRPDADGCPVATGSPRRRSCASGSIVCGAALRLRSESGASPCQPASACAWRAPRSWDRVPARPQAPAVQTQSGSNAVRHRSERRAEQRAQGHPNRRPEDQRPDTKTDVGRTFRSGMTNHRPP